MNRNIRVGPSPTGGTILGPYNKGQWLITGLVINTGNRRACCRMLGRKEESVLTGRRNHRGVPCGCLLKMKLQIPYDGISSIRPLSEEAI